MAETTGSICTRCGSHYHPVDCGSCGGDGVIQDFRDWTLGGLIEQYMPCSACRGTGVVAGCDCDAEFLAEFDRAALSTTEKRDG